MQPNWGFHCEAAFALCVLHQMQLCSGVRCQSHHEHFYPPKFPLWSRCVLHRMSGCLRPQLPSKPGSQSLRLPGPSDRKCHRPSRLTKWHSQDDTLLLPPRSMPSSSCGLLEDGLRGASDTLGPRCHRRVPKVRPGSHHSLAWHIATQHSSSHTLQTAKISVSYFKRISIIKVL